MSGVQRIAAAYLVLATVFSTACFKSKIVATRVPSTSNGGVPLGPNGKSLKLNGVSYALPRTVVKVDVPVTMSIETPAELEEFTPCFFSETVSRRDSPS